MMNRILRIGIFTAVGLFAIIAFSIYVNDHPYWYRNCNEVTINVDDATGLRRKSPVKTLGLEIGYIKSVDLGGENVAIKVCVTGPVSLIDGETRASVRSAGFLGDKFLELKPMKRIENVASNDSSNDKLRRCVEEVPIHVDDATGLRRKSPVKSIGLDIGYISSLDLEGERVLVKVCLTGPARSTADTRAIVRSTGFLGDKFLELKPVDLHGNSPGKAPSMPLPASPQSEPERSGFAPGISETQLTAEAPLYLRLLRSAADFLVPPAEAAEQVLNASREVELTDTMKRVGKLVDQLTLMVGDLREVTSKTEFKETIVNLNGAMKHLEGLLKPEGKVMKNFQASMESMKNTMASAEAVMNKIKEGEGSVGKFINDPSLYDDIRAAIQSVNLLLGKAGLLRTYVDIGAWKVPIYNGSKGFFRVQIAPNPTRYYLIGISNDPRGRTVRTTTTTSVNGGAQTVVIEDKNTEKGLLITAMFGKLFGPLDLSVGLLEDQGAVGIGYWFDPARRYGVHLDVYSLGNGKPITERLYAKATIYSSAYVTAGVDQWNKVTNVVDGKLKTDWAWFVGAGLYFDDDDLKYLLAFK